MVAVVVLGLLWVGVALGRVAVETPIVATVIVLFALGYILFRHRND